VLALKCQNHFETNRTISYKLTSSGLLEVVAFPPTMECPKLIIESENHYDPQSGCIKKVFGEVLAIINRVIIVLALKIPHKEPYEPYNFEGVRLYEKRKKVTTLS
jgi:hypothetical protein